MIPAYSPQARGRLERSFGTWQGRLPQELRLRGIRTLEQANAFLAQEYTAEFNQRFQVPALQEGSAFLQCQRKDLDVLFSVQQERVVNRDNTVVVGGKTLQIEATRLRGTLAGCSVTICEHLDRDGAVATDLTWWVATTPRSGPSCQRRSKTGAGRLWSSLNLKPDISCTQKSGHFNLLRTLFFSILSLRKFLWLSRIPAVQLHQAGRRLLALHLPFIPTERSNPTS
jgi:hypothetical protein